MAPVSRDGTSEASTSRSPLRVPMTSTQFHIPREFHSMVAGAGAGLVSSIATCPLDVIKTTLQAQHHPRGTKDYEGVYLTVRRIWNRGGVAGFYRGLGPTLAGYLPTWGIYFTVYDLVKDRLGGMARAAGEWIAEPVQDHAERWADGPEHPAADTALLHVFAAMSAGATATTITNPLWVVKTRFMVSRDDRSNTDSKAQAVLPPSEPRYGSTLDAVKSIYRHEGLKAFYKGLLPSLMGVSHVAVQFPLYEKAKAWAVSNSEGHHGPLSPSTILACSAFSKMVASLITYPHEVLRTRLQIRRVQDRKAHEKMASTATNHHPTPPSQHTPTTGHHPPSRPELAKWSPRKDGVIDTFLQIKRQDGWRGFYRGLSINLVRTVPNSAVTMLTYELIMRRLS